VVLADATYAERQPRWHLPVELGQCQLLPAIRRWWAEPYTGASIERNGDMALWLPDRGKGATAKRDANAKLIADAPDLLALVVKLEWSAVREGPGDGPMFSGRGKPYPACAICGGIKPMADGAFSESALGHRDGCELATLIAKAKGGA
jgi:hypothetical protein